MNKRFFCSLEALVVFMGLSAQTSLNSPYSQHGLGILADQSQGASRGMNGASLGLRQSNIVNTLNPASYSCVDSLTMIFDIGVSGQISHFKETSNGVTKSLNAKNASFEYAVASFRLRRNVGMALGLLPFSNIGYKYSANTYLDKTNGSLTETYSGSGGLHEAFIGVGLQVSNGLSLGANIGYLWGEMNKTVSTSSTTSIQTLSRSYSVMVNSYKLDLGLQWQKFLTKSDVLTIGATVGIGHKLGADLVCSVTNVSNQDTKSDTISNGLSIPMSYGLGFAWTHGNNLIVDADFVMQSWGNVDFPGIDVNGKYSLQSGITKNRYQVNIGADFVPDPVSRNFIKRVHYRLGGGYTTPYYNINGKNGPNEFSLSAGFGIPLQNAYNNRSILNVSAQWARMAAPGMITENIFRVNIGLTFNERWFAKWKIN